MRNLTIPSYNDTKQNGQNSHEEDEQLLQQKFIRH